MNDDKFTPGPWKSGTDCHGAPGHGGLTGRWIRDESNRIIACASELDIETAIENAKLMALAPTMLYAIRKTLEENAHLADGDDCTLIHLKRAIADMTPNAEVSGAGTASAGLTGSAP